MEYNSYILHRSDTSTSMRNECINANKCIISNQQSFLKFNIIDFPLTGKNLLHFFDSIAEFEHILLFNYHMYLFYQLIENKSTNQILFQIF